MFLAINYSQSAAELVRSGQIEIDYFKTPDWDWIVKEAKLLRPVAVHFTLEAGNDNLREVDWEKVQQLSQKTGTHILISPWMPGRIITRVSHWKRRTFLKERRFIK